MDSLTQLALGGVVAHSIGHKFLGRKVLFWGAFLGTLPDLDIILSPFLDDIERLFAHRNHSHAFFWQTVFSPLIAACICFLHKEFHLYKRWLLVCLMALYTHSIIDWFTIYGTRILQPFTDHSFALGNFFIIDPIFLIVLLVGFIMSIFLPNKRISSTLSLTVICLYTATSIYFQQIVEHQVVKALKQQNISTQQFFVTPMPFNIIWWRAVIVDGDNWYDTDYTLGQKEPLQFRHSPRNLYLEEYLEDSQSYDRLKKFNNGYYRLNLTKVEDTPLITLSDLRMGFGSKLFFQYRLASHLDQQWQLIEPGEQMGHPAIASGEFQKFFRNLWKKTLNINSN